MASQQALQLGSIRIALDLHLEEERLEQLLQVVHVVLQIFVE